MPTLQSTIQSTNTSTGTNIREGTRECASRNPSTPVSLSLLPPRNTLGIIDPSTGKPYADLIGAFLQARRIQLEEWFEGGYLAETADRKKHYKMLLDHKTLKKLLQDKEIAALVSFQIRTNGCFAVVRLFDTSKREQQL